MRLRTLFRQSPLLLATSGAGQTPVVNRGVQHANGSNHGDDQERCADALGERSTDQQNEPAAASEFGVHAPAPQLKSPRSVVLWDTSVSPSTVYTSHGGHG